MFRFTAAYIGILCCLLAASTAQAASMLSSNNVAIGFIPTADGTTTPLTSLNTLLTSASQAKAATYGWYAQTHKGVVWNGSQLLGIKSDVINSGAIFEPAVMPVQSYWGYTETNNKQAVAVAKVLKQFTDANVEVRLRFAHEANYYSSQYAADDTIQYKGGDDTDDAAARFKVAWHQVYLACQQYAPKVKMVWCPDNATVANLEKWAPDNGTYDYVALDYYPRNDAQKSAAGYLSMVKPFHDRYTNSQVKFIVSETGVNMDDTKTKDRVEWLNTLTSSTVRKALPNLVSVTWFNLDKNIDFRVLSPKGKNFNNAFLTFIAGTKSKKRSSPAVVDDQESENGEPVKSEPAKRGTPRRVRGVKRLLDESSR